MTTVSFTYDFTVHPRRRSIDSTCWVKGEQLSRRFNEVLPVSAADLLDLSLAVYAADRSSLRDFKKANTGQRCINVRVGLRNPDLWRGPEAGDHLGEFLHWLSGDVWSFQFEYRKAAQTPAESERFLFKEPLDPPVSVSLFSGGLDSLAGLACRSTEGFDGSCVLVSGHTNNRLWSKQQLQVQHIKSAFEALSPGSDTRIRHVAVDFGMRPPRRCREEKGQHTRALVFLTLGVTAALLAGADTLWVYENGVGALNLPFNETQLGVDNYRGVHPRTLMMFEALAELILGREIRVRNPFLFHTKAEMCRSLLPSRFEGAVKDTISCDSFPMRVKAPTSHCGYCTSCILRRQALHSAGMGFCEPAAAYKHDGLTNREALNKDQVYGVEAMSGQVHRLEQALASNDPWRSLTASFPELARTSAELERYEDLDSVQAGSRFVHLFQTYVCEWRHFMPHSD